MATTTRKRPASKAPGGIKANKVTSIKKLRDQVKKNSGGSDEWMLRIRKDSEIEVRFLTEPDGWVDYREHWIEGVGFFPCRAHDCQGCEADNKGSIKYAAPVLDLENDSVRIIALSNTAADQLMKKYDLKSRNTIMDRDYTIQREGGGQNDTTYYVHDGEKKRRNLSKYDVPDQDAILEFLAKLLPGATSDEDEEEEMDEMLPPRRAAAKAGRVPSQRRRSRDEDDDDEYDDDADTDTDDDEDEEEARPRRRTVKKPVKKAIKKTKGKSLR